ncbi:hypothetical protein Lal_00013790, partial [Lupinus albus]
MQFQQETRASIQRQDFCIDEFLNIDIDIDVPCISLYTCHACTDSERCDSCIDDFLNIVVDSPVQAATKPSFATFFPSVLQAPDWTPPFDLECDIAIYALGIVLARHVWHQGHFGHYKWKMCAKVKIVFVFHLLPPPNSVLLLPPWKARSLVLNSFEIVVTFGISRCHIAEEIECIFIVFRLRDKERTEVLGWGYAERK